MLIKFPHTQEVYFKDGSSVLIKDVVRIEKGTWFHLVTKTGKVYITNGNNINFVKVYKSNKTDYEK